MKKINTQENRSKRGVAIHEAGHFTVGRHLGFQVKGLDVFRDHPRSELHSGNAEIVIISPINNDSELETYLKARIMVINAGALAQAFDGTAVDPDRLIEIRKDNARDDHGKAYELFALYLNRRIAQGFDADYGSCEKWEQHPFWIECEQEAIDILRENWGAIERIASLAEHILEDCFHFGRTAEQLVSIGWGDAGLSDDPPLDCTHTSSSS